jgi:hypothetical protein
VVRDKIWQEIRSWLKPVLDDLTVGAPGSAKLGRSAAESTADEWPSNVVPLVQGVGGVRGAARMRSLSDAARAPIPGAHSSSGVAALDEPWGDAEGDPELLEFLASDLDPVPVNPEFRERLREELWEMVLDEGRAKGQPYSVKPDDLDQ